MSECCQDFAHPHTIQATKAVSVYAVAVDEAGALLHGITLRCASFSLLGSLGGMFAFLLLLIVSYWY